MTQPKYRSPLLNSRFQTVFCKESHRCTIATIFDKLVGEYVTILAKVTQLNDPTTVCTGKTKRDADATGSIRFMLWEDQVNLLAMGKSYKFVNTEVALFRGMKYLSHLRENASILPAPEVDIGTDTPEDLRLEPPKQTHVVVGVYSLISCNSCVSCKGKVESNTPLIWNLH